MRKQLGTYSGGDARVGDTVYVRGTVVSIPRSEELLVRFMSKTNDYEERVRTDLCELDLPDLPEEPGDGTILMCRDSDGVDHVFRRDDAGCEGDGVERRHELRWWSFVDQAWVSWAYVVERGGGEAQVLTVGSLPAGHPLRTLDAGERAIVDKVLRSCVGRGRTRRQITSMVDLRLREVDAWVGADAVEAYLARLVDQGVMTLRPGEGSLNDRWVWTGK